MAQPSLDPPAHLLRLFHEGDKHRSCAVQCRDHFVVRRRQLSTQQALSCVELWALSLVELLRGGAEQQGEARFCHVREMLPELFWAATESDEAWDFERAVKLWRMFLVVAEHEVLLPILGGGGQDALRARERLAVCLLHAEDARLDQMGELFVMCQMAAFRMGELLYQVWP